MKTRLSAMALASALLLGACAADKEEEGAPTSNLSGSVAVDGSSTVAPISEAIAEEFQGANPNVRVTVGIAGTGGGFKRFCADETDIADASRPITDAEKAACQTAAIEWVELPVAWDGLSVVVNPANDFADCLTVEELKKIWEPNSTVTSWRDVRSDFPAQPIKLYGPGTDSGTFDYFTEVVVGKAKSSRPDYQASEDDNVLVQGVAGDHYALGYFGHAYVQQNTDKVKPIGVDGGAGCVTATDQTITDKTYTPLSRPLFLYVKKAALARSEVKEFVRFYMDNAASVVPSTGYLALDASQYQQNVQALEGGAAAAPAPADSAAEPAPR